MSLIDQQLAALRRVYRETNDLADGLAWLRLLRRSGKAISSGGMTAPFDGGTCRSRNDNPRWHRPNDLTCRCREPRKRFNVPMDERTNPLHSPLQNRVNEIVAFHVGAAARATVSFYNDQVRLMMIVRVRLRYSGSEHEWQRHIPQQLFAELPQLDLGMVVEMISSEFTDALMDWIHNRS